jgi:NAD(P)H-dependent FMN reductase
MKIQIIIGSTREGRRGEIVAKWVYGQLKKLSNIEAELLDLRDYPLPYYDEPLSPTVLKEYRHPEGQRWADKIAEGDAYIIVTPEYNHGYPAVLKNALDYTYYSWNNKPVAFVSYGASASGARAVEQLRQVAVELQMAPIRNGVYLPLMQKPFDEQGNLQIPLYNERLQKLFEQLLWWANALKRARKEIKTV